MHNHPKEAFKSINIYFIIYSYIFVDITMFFIVYSVCTQFVYNCKLLFIICSFSRLFLIKALLYMSKLLTNFIKIWILFVVNDHYYHLCKLTIVKLYINYIKIHRTAAVDRFTGYSA